MSSKKLGRRTVGQWKSTSGTEPFGPAFPAAALLLLLVCWGCGRGADADGARKAPGIVLVSLDTLSALHLGIYGYGAETSPNIDRWAGEAIVFRHAIVQLPGTLPSHMSMMTSLYPAEHGVYPSRRSPVALSPRIPTAAEMLRAAGFRTAAFTEGGFVSALYGFDRGFDTFDDANRQWRNVLGKGIQWLRGLEEEEPFFLFLHTYKIHTPYFYPEKFRRLFWPDGDKLPFPPIGAHLLEVNRGRRSVTARDTAHLTALYDAGIRFVDDSFPELLGALDTAGLRGRTMIILTADHGEEFLEHGRFVHEQIYEPTTRVPLIIDVPEWDGRREVAELAESVDLLPTMLAFAGVERPEGLRGKDLLGIAARDGEGMPSYAYCESAVDPQRALVARDAGRHMKLLAVQPRQEGDRMAVTGVGAVAARGGVVSFLLKTNGPQQTLEVVVDGERRGSLDATNRWRRHEERFSGAAGGWHTVLFITPGETRPLVKIESGSSVLFRELSLFDLERDPGEQVNLAAGAPETTARLLIALAERIHSQERVSPPRPITRTDSHLERLRALGYVY